MSKTDVNILELDPEDQLTAFSRSSLMKTFIISALLHVLLIGGSKAAILLEPDLPPTPVVAPAEPPAVKEPAVKPPADAVEPPANAVKPPPTGTSQDPAKDPTQDPGVPAGTDPAKRDKHEGISEPAITPIDPFNLK
jgi:hypothetical protein